MPDVVGWDLNDLGDRTGLLYEIHDIIGLQVTRSVGSDAAEPGTVVAQQPAPGTQFDQMDQGWTLEVSEGGPVVRFDDLPEDVAAFAEALVGFDKTEPIIERTTDDGIAYKTDRWLFGVDCDAVDAAYRTFRDARYNTACPDFIDNAPIG